MSVFVHDRLLDLFEAEGFFVERRCLFDVVGSDCDMFDLGHKFALQKLSDSLSQNINSPRCNRPNDFFVYHVSASDGNVALAFQVCDLQWQTATFRRP